MVLFFYIFNNFILIIQIKLHHCGTEIGEHTKSNKTYKKSKRLQLQEEIREIRIN